MQSIQLDLGTRQAQRSTWRGRQQSKTRNRKRLWYSTCDVPPGRVRRVLDFAEVAVLPVEDGAPPRALTA